MTSTGTVHLQGSVYGGQQPVSGSTIQLYAAGTSGNGQAAAPLISTSQAVYSLGGANGCNAATQTCYTNVLTDANGNFTITGDYSCPAANPQVYLVATGGNPGINGLTTNPALSLMKALGPCSNLASINGVVIDELSTVSAVWALSQFMTSYANVSSSATNAAGIANAFTDAGLLNSAFNPSFPSYLTVESAKLNSLADALAPCVNSDGTTGCTALFAAATPAGGTAPTDTIGAALNIVRNPSQNVDAVYNVALGFQPFLPVLQQPPNDWTMSMTVTDPSFLLPTAIDIDSNGNVWSVGQEGLIYEINPQGKVLSGSGFGTPYLQECFGLTIDTSGNIWATDFQSTYNSPSNGTGEGALVPFEGSTGTPGQPLTFYEDYSLQYPDAVAAAPNGNVYVASSYSNTVSIYNISNLYAPIASFLGGNYAFDPQAIAVDLNNGFWLGDDDQTISHYDVNGNVLGHPTCCNEAYGMAMDAYNNVWVANYGNSTFSEVTNLNGVPVNQSSVGGIAYPAGVAVDAGQNVWFTNYRAASITEIAGNAGTVLTGTTTPLPVGTAISPSTGANGGYGGYGLDASLSDPIAIVPDASGNVWVANEGNNDFVMFFGLATPTKMPVMPSPAAP